MTTTTNTTKSRKTTKSASTTVKAPKTTAPASATPVAPTTPTVAPSAVPTTPTTPTATPTVTVYGQRVAIVTTPDGKVLPRYKYAAYLQDPAKDAEAKAKYYDFIAKKLAMGCKVSGYLFHSVNPEENNGKKWVEETRYDFALVEGKLTATPQSSAEKKSAPKSAPKKTTKKSAAPAAPKTSTKKSTKKSAQTAAPSAAPSAAPLTVEQRLDVLEKNIAALTSVVESFAKILAK